MSKKANPTLIGVFFFGGILIAIGAVFFFGTTDLFTKKQTYVSYFTQSVSGLAPGSNVKFKGVTIGKVTRVLLGIGGKDQPVYAKVFYEVDQNQFSKDFGGTSKFSLFDVEGTKIRIDEGLRPRLDFESLISGQLFVSLDFIKEAAPFTYHENPSDNALEIPVQPSDIDAILTNLTKAISNLGNVDFLAISKDLESLILSARDGINALNLADLGKSIDNLVNGPD